MPTDLLKQVTEFALSDWKVNSYSDVMPSGKFLHNRPY